MIPMEGKFSIIDAWLKMAAKNTIFGFPDPSTYWFDLGTEAKIAAAEAYLRSLGK
jgi:NDP-sugar pyrophosphorylase family protein